MKLSLSLVWNWFICENNWLL